VTSPLYHLRQAVLCLRYSPYAAMVAAGTVAIALGLSGFSLLVVRSIESVLRSYGADARLTMFLETSVTDGRALALQSAKVAGPGSTAEFVAPDVALSRLRSELGATGNALNGLAENPLPPSIEVKLSTARLAHGDLRDVREAAERLRKLPQVTQVDDGSSFIDRLETILIAVRAIGGGLFAVVLGVALFLVGNVVRLTVYARRDEIDILRLVGATDSFIATPFVLEGSIQGLAGGLLAAALVHALEISGLPRVASAFGFGQELLPPLLTGWQMGGFVVLGSALGFFASFVAVLRFLRRAM